MYNKIFYITKDEAETIKMSAMENQDVFFAEIAGHMVGGKPKEFRIYLEGMN